MSAAFAIGAAPRPVSRLHRRALQMDGGIDGMQLRGIGRRTLVRDDEIHSQP
jgi:hypothetical protein